MDKVGSMKYKACFSMISRCLLVLLLVLSGAGVNAATQEITIEVSSKSTSQREKAQQQGIEEVLVRLSGDANIASSEAVSDIIANADEWITEYGYTEKDDKYQLTLSFNEDELREELENTGAPVWGAARPDVVVWWVKGHGGLTADSDSDSGAHEALLKQAKKRGVPLVYPRLDRADEKIISPSDIRGKYTRQITKAATNYKTSFSLAVVQDGKTSLHWELLNKSDSLSDGTVEADSESALGKKLADAIADELGKRFAVSGGEAKPYKINVRGVSNLSSWRNLQKILSGQTGVKNVRATNILDNEARVSLSYSGGIEQLEYALTMLSELSLCGGEDDDVDLVLCWQ